MVKVQQSPNDRRLYRHITLQNGLQALLISDPEALVIESEHVSDQASDSASDDSGSGEDSHSLTHEGEATDAEEPEQHEKKAAAALAVGTGSFSDPLDVQGLSHYLEHMLFMGSEKYPDENEYDSYLARHGGSSNAYTELEHTNYHFDVKPDRLRGALDRFAQFFIAPLCKAEALEREVQAVNNEFVGVQQSDPCRLAQLRCHTARIGHLYRKFTWGNRLSLVEQPAAAGVDVRERLFDYYRQQYSAERMALAVLGGDSLDVLQQWVEELFAGVPSGRGPKRSFEGTPPPYEGGQLYLLPAVRQAHELTATFQLPSLVPHYLAKAEDYLGNLVGHEGRGSLLSALKARGWASALSAGVSEGGHERNSAAYMFEIGITLTEAGLQAPPGLGLAAVELLFEYLRMLRAAGPQRWLYDELADIGAMKARFLEEDDPTDYVTAAASNLLLVRPEHALLSEFLYDDWRPELITSLLDEMTPEAVRIDVQTSDFDRLAKDSSAFPGASQSEEPWFGLPYIAASVPATVAGRWRDNGGANSQELALPPRNGFIPTDFSLRCDGQERPAGGADCNGAHQKRQKKASDGHEAGAGSPAALLAPPTAVLDSAGRRLWHKLDATFRTPRACANFALASPRLYASPAAAAAVHLALRLMHDALNETTYMADVAGLQYDVWLEGRSGIEVKIDGFNHKLPLLAQTVFTSLSDFQVPTESFGRVKEALARKYQNANMNVDRHATYLRLRALKHVWGVDAVLEALQVLEPAGVQAAFRQSLDRLHVEALVEGNLTTREARELLESAFRPFQAAPLAAEERQVDRVAMLPKGSSHLIRQPAKNPEEDSSAVEVYFQCGTDGLALRARLDLLEQLAAEPCFNALRTREQLGYSAACGVRLTHNVLGFAVVVMSGSHAPSHVDARIEAFLEAFEAELADLSEDDFERNRESLISAKLQKDRSLQEHADKHWDQIASRRYCFDAREREAEALRDVTKADVLECYRRFLVPHAQQRARLAVHVVGRAHATDGEGRMPDGVTAVADPEDLRASLPQYPALESRQVA